VSLYPVKHENHYTWRFVISNSSKCSHSFSTRNAFHEYATQSYSADWMMNQHSHSISLMTETKSYQKLSKQDRLCKWQTKVVMDPPGVESFVGYALMLIT